MKPLLLTLLAFFPTRGGDEHQPWSEAYGYTTGMHLLVVVGVAQRDCSEFQPRTYTRMLYPAKMLELRGIWGTVGDTLAVRRQWIRDNCAWFSRCL